MKNIFKNIDWYFVLVILGLILLPVIIVGLAFLAKVFLVPLIGAFLSIVVTFIVSAVLLFLDLEFIILPY